MINKRDYLIKNSKKVLRKSGKRWFTVSVALLAMLGFGSLAKKSANADSIDPSNVVTNWQPKTQPSNVNIQDKQINSNQPTKTTFEQKASILNRSNLNRPSSPTAYYTSGLRVGTSQSNQSLQSLQQSGKQIIANLADQINDDQTDPSLADKNEPQNGPLSSFQAEQAPVDNPHETFASLPQNINYRQQINAPQSGVVNGKTLSGDQFNKYMSAKLVNRLFNDINQARKKAGLQPVGFNATIEKAAMMRAKQAYVEYSTQPLQYLREKDVGNNTDSDNWAHGNDDGHNFQNDMEAIGAKVMPSSVSEVVQIPNDSHGQTRFMYGGGMPQNAGSSSLGISGYHDIYPSRWVIDYNRTPQDAIDNDFRGMVYYDRSSDNGHTSAILDPLADLVGIGVYYYGGQAVNNPILKGKNLTVKGIHMTIEEDFGTSTKANKDQYNYLTQHLSPVTTWNGHHTEAAAFYRPYNVIWQPSTGHDTNYFETDKTFIKSGTNGITYNDAPVSTDPASGKINGYIMQAMYLSRLVTLMPTLKIATDPNRNVWGQFKASFEGRPSQVIYMPIKFAGRTQIPYPNVTNSSSDNTPSSNTPDDQPSNPASGHSDSNQTGENVPNSGQSGASDIPSSGNNGNPSATVTGGGNNRNNSHQSGAANNNNNTHHGGNDGGSGGSDNNNPASNNVTGGGSTVNNNGHGAMTSNTTNNGHASFATALGLLLGGGDNTESSNADILAWIQDNDKNAQMARNEFQEKFDLETQLQQDTQSQDNANAIKLHAIQDSFANQERAIEARYNLQNL